MKLQSLVERDYSFHAAGRVWLVPELRLVQLPDGTVGLPMDEANRIHRAIANALCAAPASLTAAELEFLCDVANVTAAEVADALGVHRSAMTRWRTGSSAIRPITSRALKRWFWFQLFGDSLSDGVIPLSAAQDDDVLLARLTDEALARHLVSEIHERRAATG